MDLDLTTAALVLPAIPFLMLTFGTRFTVVSELIRKIHDEYAAEIDLDDVRTKRMLGEISTLKKQVPYGALAPRRPAEGPDLDPKEEGKPDKTP